MPVNADWIAISGAARMVNQPDVAAVATNGSYADLGATTTIRVAQVNND
jgi:hypothetical protein